MRSLIITSHPTHLCVAASPIHGFPHPTNNTLNFLLPKSNVRRSLFSNSQRRSSLFITYCSSPSGQPSDSRTEAVEGDSTEAVVANDRFHSAVESPRIPSFVTPMPNLSLSDKAFFLLAFIACATSVAFASLVVAAVPTLFAMRNAAISLSKLADTAREELPSTMAAVRLSGMEISDLTLELSDLSQEIADGVSKSTQALQAAEAGIRQIGSAARKQTISMIEERASLPKISLQPVVAGAARKTSRAVGRATKTFMNIMSRRKDDTSEECDEGIVDMEDF
ncbi:uncharacterized protein LOC114745132 isoform X1 [Neltuma alba]|uniref:uncharacterized protein LOC114745132 isoform X1 n=1 Tax=Neltuma alba TaxID=207710 RepID=UPI0010A2DE62|nr:uncharacterized protein LOC114745132 isoform X1 [Prosopis alba]